MLESALPQLPGLKCGSWCFSPGPRRAKILNVTAPRHHKWAIKKMQGVHLLSQPGASYCRVNKVTPLQGGLALRTLQLFSLIHMVAKKQ